MGLTRILKESFGKLLTAPSLILWVFFSMLLLAVPASLAMRNLISDSIGPSLVNQGLRSGFDLGWWGEFLYRNGGGFANTFSPDVTGGLPVLTNLETFLDGRLGTTRVPVLLSGVLFLLVWIFLQGGIIDRYARPDEAHSRERLFARCARNFYRMLRLAILSVAGYLVIFWFLGERLNDWKSSFFSSSTAEGPVLLTTVFIYLLLFFVWWVFSIGMDYAKVALVAERRHSAIFSTMRGFGFLLSHLGKCIALAVLMLILTLLVGGLYFFLAPGPGQGTWQTVGLAFLVGQVYLLVRIAARLFAISAEATLFTAGEAALPEPHYLEPENSQPYQRAPLAPTVPVEPEVVSEKEEEEET